MGGKQKLLDFQRIRRRFDGGNEDRSSKCHLFSERAENGPDGPIRSLCISLHGGRLPRHANGGHPQGRALHDPEINLRQKMNRSANPSPQL